LQENSVVLYTPEQWQQKIIYWGSKCYLNLPGCTGDADSKDHVIPITKGGGEILANLRPACRSCNTRKLNQWPYPIPYYPQ
jgi:5-methylcytosine-specific restriction endonuclease McrA